ncbi:helix-turn-helix domain-containing protein [bacterium]|nr:helix-turn-helix domain-containing protein [bacterium]
MKKLKRFWIRKEFMKYFARNIKTSDQAVYMALSFYVNREGRAFVGYRTIAKKLGINKDTVTRSVKRLIASGLVRRLDKLENGKPSELELTTVLFDGPQPSESFRPKELKKELFKEGKRFVKNSNPKLIGEIIEKDSPALKAMRKKWGKKIM